MLSPIPQTSHASGGPSLGHSLRSPVALEMLSFPGPRHWGQSKPTLFPAGVAVATPISSRALRASSFEASSCDWLASADNESLDDVPSRLSARIISPACG